MSSASGEQAVGQNTDKSGRLSPRARHAGPTQQHSPSTPQALSPRLGARGVGGYVTGGVASPALSLTPMSARADGPRSHVSPHGSGAYFDRVAGEPGGAQGPDDGSHRLSYVVYCLCLAYIDGAATDCPLLSLQTLVAGPHITTNERPDGSAPGQPPPFARPRPWHVVTKSQREREPRRS